MIRNITYIYVLRCPISGDIRYVGKANNPKKRFREHLRSDKTASTHKINWIQSLLSKGLNPLLDIIEEVPMENWKERERYYITKYRKKYKLTNFTDGGEGSFKGNQTSFKKSMVPWNKGTRKKKPCSVCSVLFEVSPSGDKKYKCCSKECSSTYKKISSNKGRFKKGSVPWNKDKSGYNTSREKVVTFVNKKTIFKIDKTTDKVLNTYTSIVEASKFTGIGRTNINNVLVGRVKTAGGFKWKREIEIVNNFER